MYIKLCGLKYLKLYYSKGFIVNFYNRIVYFFIKYMFRIVYFFIKYIIYVGYIFNIRNLLILRGI